MPEFHNKTRNVMRWSNIFKDLRLFSSNALPSIVEQVRTMYIFEKNPKKICDEKRILLGSC